MKFKHLIYFFFSALIAIGLASCGQSPSEKDKNSSEFPDRLIACKDNLKNLSINMPPPSEIPYMLQTTGAEFNESLIKPSRQG